ncbi:MAG TPA: SDR family oxidoreductase [Puia sp.]|jgi:L-fucose dehydrogenase
MDLRLRDKVIIVTGGASGIGEGICRKLAEEGAIPCILDRDEQNTLRVFSELSREYGIMPFYHLMDLTDPAACNEAVARVLGELGRIDGLVNNAGLNDGVGLANGTYEKFVGSLDRNVGHYFSVASATLPALKLSFGAIVNICSKTAITGQGGTSGYAAANGERLTLTKEWAAELQKYGIRVNAVVVAECMTPQYRWWIGQQADPEAKLREIVSKIPLENRMTTAEEIANMAAMLLSPASAAVNGQLLHVDGGYVVLDRAAS